MMPATLVSVDEYLTTDYSPDCDYVDGVLENSGELNLAPQGPGLSSVGVRINLRDYFKGAIAVSRMTRRALSPEEFLRK